MRDCGVLTDLWFPSSAVIGYPVGSLCFLLWRNAWFSLLLGSYCSEIVPKCWRPTAPKQEVAVSSFTHREGPFRELSSQVRGVRRKASEGFQHGLGARCRTRSRPAKRKLETQAFRLISISPTGDLKGWPSIR